MALRLDEPGYLATPFNLAQLSDRWLDALNVRMPR